MSTHSTSALDNVPYRVDGAPRHQEAVQKVLSMFGEMTNVALDRYGAIPLRHKAYLGNYLDLTGTYADVLGRIKKTLVFNIFEQRHRNV